MVHTKVRFINDLVCMHVYIQSPNDSVGPLSFLFFSFLPSGDAFQYLPGAV